MLNKREIDLQSFTSILEIPRTNAEYAEAQRTQTLRRELKIKVNHYPPKQPLDLLNRFL